MVVGQALVAEKQYVVAIPSLLDGIHLSPADTGEIHALYFGADDAKGNDF
jgi:hypothetical protein